MIRFGPSGNSESFYEAGYKSSYQMPKWLNDMGLKAYEYQCSKGVKISEPTATKIGEEALINDISLSIHAPYYINMASEEKERTAKTVLANMLTAFGFALVLLAAMTLALRHRTPRLPVLWWGLLWGLAGYVSFFAAPAMGLPPEIPGSSAAPLQARQIWWLFAVACTVAGLAGGIYGKSVWRVLTQILPALPMLVGAPSVVGGPFAGYSPEIAREMALLSERFFVATAIANGIFWLALGLTGAWVTRRYLPMKQDC